MKLLHEEVKGYTGTHKSYYRIYLDETTDKIFFELDGRGLYLRDSEDYSGTKIRNSIYYITEYKTATLKILNELMEFEASRKNGFSNGYKIKLDEYPSINREGLKKIGYTHEESVLVLFYFMNVLLEGEEEIYFKHDIFELLDYNQIDKTLPNRGFNDFEKSRIINKIDEMNSKITTREYPHLLDLFEKNNITVKDFKESVGMYLTFNDYDGLNGMEDISEYIQYSKVNKFINKTNTLKYIEAFIENGIEIKYDLTLEELLKHQPPLRLLTECSVTTVVLNIDLFKSNKEYLSWLCNSIISEYVSIVNNNLKFVALFDINEDEFMSKINDDMLRYIKTKDASIVKKYNKLLNKFNKV